MFYLLKTGGIYNQKLLFGFVAFIFFAMFIPYAVEASSDQLIIVNKSTNKLAFYVNGELVKTFTVATGRTKSLTPEGTYKVNVKWECPIYYATNKKGCKSDNPLGHRWIGLNVPETSGYTYGIHGNNNPNSIGTYASAGCVRMHNHEVTWLFDRVEKGAKVVILRSNDSFDNLAKKHGYGINKGKEKESGNSSSTFHTVKKGDTLYKISKQYGTSVTKLRSLNDLKSDLIKIGQKLVVKQSSVSKPVEKNIPKEEPKQAPKEVPKESREPHGIEIPCIF